MKSCLRPCPSGPIASSTLHTTADAATDQDGADRMSGVTLRPMRGPSGPCDRCPPLERVTERHLSAHHSTHRMTAARLPARTSRASMLTETGGVPDVCHGRGPPRRPDPRSSVGVTPYSVRRTALWRGRGQGSAFDQE